MKRKLISIGFVCLTLLFFTHPVASAPEHRPVVQIVYFRARDMPARDNVDAEIDALIKQAQRYFADEMEAHGFGRKTFAFETDARGNATIHHVVGKFDHAHYLNNTRASWNEEILDHAHHGNNILAWNEEIHAHVDISEVGRITLVMIETQDTEFPVCGIGGGGGSGGYVHIYCWTSTVVAQEHSITENTPFEPDSWTLTVVAHELGHAFGLEHNFGSDTSIMSYDGDLSRLSECDAAFLDVHRAFNTDPTDFEDRRTAVKMLAASLAAPPNAIRLRFEVTEPDGLYQAQVLTKTLAGQAKGFWEVLECKTFNGTARSKVEVEIVTTRLSPQNKVVGLSVMDVRGNTFTTWDGFPIDVVSLLPPPEAVFIPDANLAAAVQESLGLARRTALTTHAMLALTHLNAPNRQITDLTGLEHARSLRALSLGGEYIAGEGLVNSNAVTDLSPLKKLTQLISLDLGDNAISDVSVLSGLTQLTDLSLSGNPITDFSALAGLTQLTSLNGISDISALLRLIQLPPEAIFIPDANLAAAVQESLGLARRTALTTHAMLALTHLEAPNRQITDLTGLEHARHLRRLNLGGEYIAGEGFVNSNAVTDLSPLEKLTQLTYLYLRDNTITDISPLAGLTQLKSLNLWGNAITDISPLSGLTQLTYFLNLRDNTITDISPLAGLTQLTYLYLGGNPITDISPLAGLTQLKSLELWDNPITDISPLSGLTQLTSLGLSYNGISDISPLAGLTQLTSLNLWGNAITDISPLAGLTQLTSLYLGNNAITDVSVLSGLTQLTSLYLVNNAITDVSVLSGLTQLTFLNLGNNSISDVSVLSGLTQLTFLNLGNNSILDISTLSGLTQLTELRLRYNPLNHAAIHTHIPALQANGVNVTFDPNPQAALVKISGESQEGEAGTQLPRAFVISAQDEHGKPMSGVSVQFTVTEGGGRLLATTATTNANGRAQSTLILGANPGVNQVRVTAAEIRYPVTFSARSTIPMPLAVDVNGDGLVTIADLELVTLRLGQTGTDSADVNGDGVVDLQDWIAVAEALGDAASPAARAVTLSGRSVAELQHWLDEARHSALTDPAQQRVVAILEQLLAALLPKETALLPNYPNPFNPETWIPYQLSAPGPVTLTIYGVAGKVVRRLEVGYQPAGSYRQKGRAAYWDGCNTLGEPVASGIYFYTLTAPDFIATRKMLIRK